MKKKVDLRRIAIEKLINTRFRKESDDKLLTIILFQIFQSRLAISIMTLMIVNLLCLVSMYFLFRGNLIMGIISLTASVFYMIFFYVKTIKALIEFKEGIAEL